MISNNIKQVFLSMGENNFLGLWQIFGYPRRPQRENWGRLCRKFFLININQVIHDYVKNMHFFRKFKEQIQEQCDDDKAIFTILKEMTIEKMPGQSLVFRENDPSNNKAYIVLDGEVGIYKKPIGTVFQEDYDKL